MARTVQLRDFIEAVAAFEGQKVGEVQSIVREMRVEKGTVGQVENIGFAPPNV